MITNKYGFILPRYAQPTHYECIRGRYVAYYDSPKGEYGIMCEIKPSRKPEGKKVIGYSVFTKGEGVHYVEKCTKSQAAAFKYLETVGVETGKKTTFTILTNRTDGWENCYNDYLECCEDNGVEPAGEGSSEYWDWVYEEVDNTIDCDLKNMEYSKIKESGTSRMSAAETVISSSNLTPRRASSHRDSGATTTLWAVHTLRYACSTKTARNGLQPQRSEGMRTESKSTAVGWKKSPTLE